MLMLVREHHLTPAMVSGIASQTHPRRLAHTNRPDPRGALDAKFSVQYCLARALVSGQVLIEHFEDGSYDEPEVRAVLRRVTATAWPERKMDLSEHFGADVQVTLTDGRTVAERVDDVRGTSENPMSREEIVAKARDLITPVLGGAACQKLVDRILDLERVKNIRELRPLLQG